MDTADLPAVNATLNGLAATLLIAWRWAIARDDRALHQRLMVAALTVSGAFLVTYLIYHGLHGSTRFAGEGWSRPLYFSILISHTVLATAMVPLLIFTLRPAIRADFERHRRWARITWPIWVYVSITGVVIYFMLYHWFATPAA